jgi:CHAT domain-containing protein
MRDVSTWEGSFSLTAPMPERIRHRLVRGCAAIVLCAALGWGIVRWRSDEALVVAADRLPHRVVAGRLSGRWAYRSVAAGTRSANSAATASKVRARAVLAAPDSSAHERGLAHLLLGEAEDAVRELAAGGDRADVLNDLAVAYLEREMVRDDPRDLLAAIECAERAWRADRSPEIAWNRALALERAGFREHSRVAWSEAIALEPGSGWSDEAAEHVRALSNRAVLHSRDELSKAMREGARRSDASRLRALAAEDREQFRVVGEEVLLPEAAAVFPLRADAWNAARQVSAILRERGETLLSESLDALDGADSASLAAAARALADFHRGRELQRPDQYDEALVLLRNATNGLTRARNPMAVRAAVFQATIQMYSGHASKAIALIDATLASNRQLDHWPLAAAQLHWVRGLALHNLGDPGNALRAYEEASRAIATIEESGSRAGIEQVYADALRDIGNDREAWRHLLAAAATLDASTPALRKLNVLNGVVQQLTHAGYRLLPSLIHADVLHLARAAGDPLFLCSTLLVAAQLAIESRDFPSAQDALREAEQTRITLGDSAMTRRVSADIETTRYRLMSAKGHEPDIDPLTRSLALVATADNHTRIAELHLLRARAFLRRSVRDRARDDLREGLTELESQRETLLGEERRTQAAVTAQLVDEWIALDLDGGDAEAAFDVAERARARLLLERTSSDHRALQWSEIRSRLPQDVVLVVSSVLRDRVVVWRGTRDGLRATSTPLDVTALRALDADRLYDHLCRAALEGTGASRVVFVPDSELFDVPFAALRDRQTGRYVIEQHEVSIQPSATLAVLAEVPQQRHSTDRSLVIGVTTAPGMRVLPAVSTEVQSVATQLRQATLLVDESVNAESFERMASGSDIVHFAGHAIADPIRPERSALLLGDHVLTAAQISAMHLEGVQLIVLAACRTAEGTSVAEAPITLATAFLLAGARTVIASTADADDDASRRLFGEFYFRYQRGQSAEGALRAAQLALLHDPRYSDPRSWSPFIVIGSSGIRRTL